VHLDKSLLALGTPLLAIWPGRQEAAGGLIGEPGSGLLGDVGGMIVENQLDRRMGRTGGIEKLEEFDELAGDGDP
jgi:hypothetical protein